MKRYILRIPSIDRVVELDREHYTLGRSDSCDIVIKDSTLSRMHAELNLVRGGWTVCDCNSTNGVSVNDRRLGPNETVPVRDGDSIILGSDVELQLEAEEVEDEGTVAVHTRSTAPAPSYAPEPAPAPTPQPELMRTEASPAAADSGSFMARKFEEIRKKKKTIGIITLVLFALGPATAIVNPAVSSFFVLAGVVLGFIYLARYKPIDHNAKRFPAEELNRLIEGSWTETPVIPGSGIYVGERAFFCEKNKTLVPREGIALVYMYKMSYMLIPLYRVAIFKYANGMTIEAKISQNELVSLLEDYLLSDNPGVLVGYTQENLNAYAQMIRK